MKLKLPRQVLRWRVGGRNLTRSLRFRLTLSYIAFFAILLSALGVLFRETLAAVLEQQSRALLEEEWAAINGYLRFERRKPWWDYNPQDADESAIVARLRRHFLLTDAEGNVLEVSTSYGVLGAEKPEEIRRILTADRELWRRRVNPHGVTYLVRSGVVHDDRRRKYFASVALPLTSNDQTLAGFAWNYFMIVPLMILSSSLLGWFMAKRALQPLKEVARTAQRIGGSNLDLRIPARGSGDELDHLIQTFNRMIERLSESFEQIRQFSTDVSHELRTPLTAVRGQLEVALFAARSEEQYREAMINALEDVDRLSQIVRALLLLSQAETGQLALQKSRVDFGALLSDMVDEFQIPAEAAGVRLTAAVGPGCMVDGDRIQLERLISNLLSNAVKYTPAGGSVLTRLAADSDRGMRMEVEDTGQGIPQAALPHIFDRFYRVQPGDRNPDRGLGLGLSFVAWIVKAHGGRIEVQSELGKGSCFRVWLPAANDAPNLLPEGMPAGDRAD